jgi:hypothetical protein
MVLLCGETAVALWVESILLFGASLSTTVHYAGGSGKYLKKVFFFGLGSTFFGVQPAFVRVNLLTKRELKWSPEMSDSAACERKVTLFDMRLISPVNHMASHVAWWNVLIEIAGSL